MLNACFLPVLSDPCCTCRVALVVVHGVSRASCVHVVVARAACFALVRPMSHVCACSTFRACHFRCAGCVSVVLLSRRVVSPPRLVVLLSRLVVLHSGLSFCGQDLSFCSQDYSFCAQDLSSQCRVPSRVVNVLSRPVVLPSRPVVL